MQIEYKGYIAKVYPPEHIGDVFYGKVINIKRGFIHFTAELEQDIELEFQKSIDDYLDWHRETDDQPEKPY